MFTSPIDIVPFSDGGHGAAGKGGRKGRGGKGKGGGRGKGSGGGSSSSPSPALLTANLKNAQSLDELFQHVANHEALFNHIHLSACWNAIGHLAQADRRPWFDAHAAALEALVARTTSTVAASGEIRARELANIAHGVAKSGRGGAVGALMAALARAIERRVADCNAQELANVAWAFAKAGVLDGALFAALARAAERHLRNEMFKAQELANTAWGFATAGHADAALFAALARSIERRLGDFSVQGLTNTAWAFAKAAHVDAPLFLAMAAVARQRVGDFGAQDVAHMAWAFAKLGQYHAELFAALARAAQAHLERFSVQGLANTVWAFAKAGHLDDALFGAFAAAIARRAADFNAQDVSNAAWAFAKACHTDHRLFAALARAAERCIDGFNAQDCVNTAWAFAKLGELDGALFAAVARSLAANGRLDELGAPRLANVAWAFAKASLRDGPLFAALARTAEARAADFSAGDLANIAWAFANAGVLDAQLFGALARQAELLLDDFDDEALDNGEWAFARAGEQKVAKRLRQRRKRAAGGGGAGADAAAAVDVSGCGRIVVAGGGIGGAAAAAALQRRGFDVVVLEADASFDSRKQGYGLTIQRQDATQALGISLAADDAPSTSHYTFAADGAILGFYGEAFGAKSKGRQEADNSGRFVHIPRQVLRQRLVEQLRPGTIRWGSRLRGFEYGERGVTVTLTDGTSIDAALLVGSDGIFSTVRRQLDLAGDRLNYVGLIVVLGIVEEGAAAVPPLARRRIFETVDGTTRIYAMPFTTTSTMWQLSFPYGEDAARALVKDPAALKAEIVRRCGGWHEPIPALLRGTPLESMAGYPVYDRDLLEADVLRRPGKEKEKKGAPPAAQRRVTLIGDAAHPMTPFRAQGANQALSDAVLLADALVEGIAAHGAKAGVDAALPGFERKMLSRSARTVIGSREKAKELHSSLALQPARKVQREAGGVDMPKVVEVLRAGGIGAHSATEKRGLDALVAEAIERSEKGKNGKNGGAKAATKTAKPPAAAAIVPFSSARAAKRKGAGDDPSAARKKRRAEAGGAAEAAAADWGFKWRRALCARLGAAAGGGVRRKHLRKAVVDDYLGHLAGRREAAEARRWWEAHPVELQALFRRHLRKAKRKGRLRVKGKMVIAT